MLPEIQMIQLSSPLLEKVIFTCFLLPNFTIRIYVNRITPSPLPSFLPYSLNCECVTLHGKTDLAGVIKDTDVGMEGLSWIVCMSPV